MKYATVVIPFGYTPRWLQTVISSLKKFKNERDFDIIVMNNTPERPDIRAILDTPLGEDVQVCVPPASQRGHGGALDHAIQMVKTPFMFALESDCVVLRDGWLDWYASFIRDKYTAMAGWFWCAGEEVDDERHYINSSATLYDNQILRRLRSECRQNPDTIIAYGINNEKRMDHKHSAKKILEKEMGPFSETRGYQQVYPVCPKPDKWWMEPGAWLYYRASCQWECARVPGDIVYNPPGMQPEYQLNYYGDSLEEAYAFHFWGGTVAHNFEKHLVTVPWEAQAMQWWLMREHDQWELWVPEDIRKMSIEKGIVRSLQDELDYAQKRVHVVVPGCHYRVYHGNATEYITGEEPEPGILGDGLRAEFLYWDVNGLMVKFLEDPMEGFEYPGQELVDGKYQAFVHPNQCVMCED